MSNKKSWQKLIATILSLAMILSLFPATVFAAGPPPENPDVIRFKNMHLVNLRNSTYISEYDYQSKGNHFISEVALDQNQTWLKLSYAIEVSQYVKLELYKLGEEYDIGTTQIFEYNAEGPDPETFLENGTRLGYLYAVPIRDNVEADSGANLEEAEQVHYKPISNEEWGTIVWNTIKDKADEYGVKRTPQVMDHIYAFGFEGQKYIAPEAGTSLDAEVSTENNAPEAEAPAADDPAADNATEDNKDAAPADDTADDVSTFAADEANTPEEAAATKDTASEEIPVTANSTDMNPTSADGEDTAQTICRTKRTLLPQKIPKLLQRLTRPASLILRSLLPQAKI